MVAKDNGIPLFELECPHEGNCYGMCSYCEDLDRYIECELEKRVADSNTYYSLMQGQTPKEELSRDYNSPRDDAYEDFENNDPITTKTVFLCVAAALGIVLAIPLIAPLMAFCRIFGEFQSLRDRWNGVEYYDMVL